jgi:NADPH-dependent 2,4-dienoyl-CoA reductase/sulfur reductase-like enzyme
MTERLVVIGGDAAGMSAASQARRLRPDLEIVVFERGAYTSYAACGLPYVIGGEVEHLEDLVARTPEQFRAGGIDVRTCHEVVAIDTDHRMVQVAEHGTSTVQWEGYDELLIATGGSPVRPPLPGIGSDGVYDIRTLPDAEAMRRALDDGARSAVIVGGGYIGVEMAESLVHRGLRVTMVEQADQPMLTLDADMAALVTDALVDLGVDVHLGSGVTSFATLGGRVTAVVTGSGSFDADVVVIGLGVRPNAGLAVDAGIPVGPSGGIAVDERMHTRVDGVWAAGDCVESHHRVSGQQMVVALGTHANKQGRVAGTNIGGGAATFGGVLGTAITRVGRTEVARTGLNEREAAAAGFDAFCVMSDAKGRAGFLPGADPMRVKIVAERGTGRLLGGQIVGGAGSGKRIDILATALWNEMTVAEVGGMDLSYAPPFSPVWDPVLLAAGKAATQVAS